MVARRALTFDTLGAAVRDAEHLLAVGYEPAGKWDLAQVCNHLADWLRFAMDGFPTPPLLIRPMFWLLRNTIGPGELRRLIGGKPFPAGSPAATRPRRWPGWRRRFGGRRRTPVSFGRRRSSAGRRARSGSA